MKRIRWLIQGTHSIYRNDHYEHFSEEQRYQGSEYILHFKNKRIRFYCEKNVRKIIGGFFVKKIIEEQLRFWKDNIDDPSNGDKSQWGLRNPSEMIMDDTACYLNTDIDIELINHPLDELDFQLETESITDEDEYLDCCTSVKVKTRYDIPVFDDKTIVKLQRMLEPYVLDVDVSKNENKLSGMPSFSSSRDLDKTTSRLIKSTKLLYDALSHSETKYSLFFELKSNYRWIINKYGSISIPFGVLFNRIILYIHNKHAITTQNELSDKDKMFVEYLHNYYINLDDYVKMKTFIMYDAQKDTIVLNNNDAILFQNEILKITIYHFNLEKRSVDVGVSVSMIVPEQFERIDSSQISTEIIK